AREKPVIRMRAASTPYQASITWTRVAALASMPCRTVTNSATGQRTERIRRGGAGSPGRDLDRASLVPFFQRRHHEVPSVWGPPNPVAPNDRSALQGCNLYVTQCIVASAPLGIMGLMMRWGLLRRL